MDPHDHEGEAADQPLIDLTPAIGRPSSSAVPADEPDVGAVTDAGAGGAEHDVDASLPAIPTVPPPD